MCCGCAHRSNLFEKQILEAYLHDNSKSVNDMWLQCMQVRSACVSRTIH